jgi:hypothetical protein
MVYINLFITFSNFLQDNTKCFNTSCRILNLTAAVTIVLINKYTVIIATNRLGRNIKTNTKTNVYIFVLIFGNTISIPHKNTQNVVNIVGIQPSMKTNTKNTNTKNTQKTNKQ